jgi:hypothetical protein
MLRRILVAEENEDSEEFRILSDKKRHDFSRRMQYSMKVSNFD